MNRSKYCVANWKMNLTSGAGVNFIHELVSKNIMSDTAQIILCPSFTGIIPAVKAAQDSTIEIGAQNVYFESSGAYTGEVSTAMLKEAGCQWVILGHSERRHIFKENDQTIAKKIQRALQDDLKIILCVGETLEQREAGQTDALLKSQLESAFEDMSEIPNKGFCIAYEPVWAIGTGRTATPEQAGGAHGLIRDILNDMSLPGNAVPLLYGGSVNPENAKELLITDGIDGFLIGGASLKCETFCQIYEQFKS
ncbi:MAG: triose-phosphate isomerase [FCB group bacterium]|nr:triose-phosphate isomerase [FCB group bacterium]